MKNVWILVLIMFPSLASAHPGHSEFGFISGVVHPFTGIDHVAAMIGIGLVSSLFFGRESAMKWRLLGTLTVSLVMGAVLAAVGVNIPMFESLIALSVVATGVMLSFGTSGRTVNKGLAYLLGSFSLFHGYVHILEVPSLQALEVYTLGFVAASAALYIAGFAIGAKVETLNLKKRAFLYSGSMYLAMTAMFLV